MNEEKASNDEGFRDFHTRHLQYYYTNESKVGLLKISYYYTELKGEKDEFLRE